MGTKKKLQVFVSSTYADLKEERQAAVEAILSAGHIPAGMELFSAGDETQMELIRQWIDESDVFCLILGGRYGSVEEKSGKSYTHLEFDYAVKKNKPFFSLVILDGHLDERVKLHGKQIVETKHAAEYEEFAKIVKSRMVKFWSSKADIQLAIMQKLSELILRDDLIGWIPGNQGADPVVANQLARLVSENDALRKQTGQTHQFTGLTYDELCESLKSITLQMLDFPQNDLSGFSDIQRFAQSYGHIGQPTLLHLFIANAFTLSKIPGKFWRVLEVHGLVILEPYPLHPGAPIEFGAISLSDDGKRFFNLWMKGRQRQPLTD